MRKLFGLEKTKLESDFESKLLSLLDLISKNPNYPKFDAIRTKDMASEMCILSEPPILYLERAIGRVC